MTENNIEYISCDKIKVYDGSHNTSGVISMLKESIQKYGITQPIVVDGNYQIVAGNAVYKAAVELGFSEVPCIVKDDISEELIRQYRIADNKTAEFASWNEKKLKKELSYLEDPNKLQFCFDENILDMLGMAEKETKQAFETTIPVFRPIDRAYEEQQKEMPISNAQNIEHKHFQPQEYVPPVSEKEQIKNDAAEERFKNGLKEIAQSHEAKPRNYLEYVCSKCKRTVIIKQ